jgi:hypothetical protein
MDLNFYEVEQYVKGKQWWRVASLIGGQYAGWKGGLASCM